MVDHATTREFRHSATGETNNKQSTGVKVNRFLHPVSSAALANFNTSYATSTTLNSGVMSATAPGATQFIRASFPIRPTVKKMKFLENIFSIFFLSYRIQQILEIVQ
jgi:hypothetical protein